MARGDLTARRGVLAAAALLVGLGPACGGDESSGSQECGACACTLETFEVESAFHVDGEIDYPDPPPVGGDHNQCWAPWGVHDEVVREENWVHNLEHGGVVVLYTCTDCDADVADAADFVESQGGGTAVLTPYTGMDSPWALVAWGTRLLLDCWDRDAAQEFYDDHHDDGPESTTDPPPAWCP